MPETRLAPYKTFSISGHMYHIQMKFFHSTENRCFENSEYFNISSCISMNQKIKLADAIQVFIQAEQKYWLIHQVRV